MKKILFFILGVIFGFVSLFFVSGINTVYAQQNSGGNTQVKNEKKTKTSEQIASVLSAFLNVLMILIWPLLFIAGLALDNGFVTGEIFKIDDAIWYFWQAMRNFAFYIIGFLFFFGILAYIIGYGKDKFTPKKLILKTLIASVAINISYFVFLALLDISTILTYSVGALPFQIIEKTIKSDSNIGDSKSLQIVYPSVFLDLQSTKELGKDKKNFILAYKFNGEYILPCILSGQKLVDQEKWNGYVDSYTKKIQDYIKGLGDQAKHNVKVNNISSDKCALGYGKIIKFEAGKQVVDQNGKVLVEVLNKGKPDLTKNIFDVANENMKGWVGPLYFLYGVLLDYSQMSNYIIGGIKGTITLSLEFVLKTLVAVMLFIPLVALALAFIARGVLLWLIAAFLPLFIVVWVFDFKMFKDKFQKFNINSILGLIFLPVVAVFALGISILFLSTLNGMIGKDGEEKNKINILNGIQQLGVKQNVEVEMQDGKKISANCIEVFKGYGGGDNGLSKVCLKYNAFSQGWNGLTDIFSWLIVNFFGIAVLWGIFFAALRTSALTASITGAVESFGKQLFATVPWIPTPAGAQSIGSLEKAWGTIKSYPGRYYSEQYNQSKIRQLIDRVSNVNSIQEVKSNIDNAKNLSELNNAVSSLPPGYSYKDVEKKIITKIKKLFPNNHYLQSINSVDDIYSNVNAYMFLKSNGFNIDEFVKKGPDTKYFKEQNEEKIKQYWFNLFSDLKVKDKNFYYKNGIYIFDHQGDIYLFESNNMKDITKPEDIRKFEHIKKIDLDINKFINLILTKYFNEEDDVFDYLKDISGKFGIFSVKKQGNDIILTLFNKDYKLIFEKTKDGKLKVKDAQLVTNNNSNNTKNSNGGQNN